MVKTIPRGHNVSTNGIAVEGSTQKIRNDMHVDDRHVARVESVRMTGQQDRHPSHDRYGYGYPR